MLVDFQTANKELVKVKTYREFLQSCEADFWKSVGNDKLLSEISEFMRTTDHESLKNTAGEPLKLMEWDGHSNISDITPYLAALNQYLITKKIRTADLDKNQVESINARLQFTSASLENKLKLLRRFYGTYESGGRRVWLDSSAIAPIADQVGLKLKVYN